MDVNDEHPLNQYFPIEVTVFRIEMGIIMNTH
jgi:hypothetical protein